MLKPPTKLAAFFYRFPLVWLWTLVVGAYANALAGVFQFDDYNVIVDLDSVHSLSAWWVDSGQGIRPLLKLSYALNWIAGADATGFHVVNIAIHGLAVSMVYLLMQFLLNAWKVDGPHAVLAWTGAALFALHPVQTEAVTYVCGRSSSLMALLYLVGVWLHLCTHPLSGKWRPWAVAACFALALCVKETAVTFPVALLMADLTCGMNGKDAVKRAWRSWAVLWIAIGVFVWNDAYRAAMERSFEFNSLAGNLSTQLTAMPYFVRQTVLPLWLNIDPDIPVQQDFSNGWIGAVLLAGLALSAHLLRHKPWLTFASGWFVLHLLPLYVLLPRLDVANDRQLYLAIWPLGLVCSVALFQTLSRRLASAACSLMLVWFTALTVLRNDDYRSEVALWEQTVALSPQKARVHNNLGFAYKEAGRVGEARREYLAALQLDPSNTKARLNLRRLNAELKGRLP